MFQLYSPNTLHDIQITTNCRIEIDDVSGTISVIGDDEADTYRAISKLSNLEKIDVRTFVVYTWTYAKHIRPIANREVGNQTFISASTKLFGGLVFSEMTC